MTKSSASKSPPLRACIVGDPCAVSLWGLTAAERLRRQLKAAGVAEWVRTEDLDDAAAILIRSDYLFEDRTVTDLIKTENCVLVVRDDTGSAVAVAAHVAAVDATAVARQMQGAGGQVQGVSTVTAQQLSSAYMGDLLKASPPVVVPVTQRTAPDLERHLFDGSYKGVTDLITKWVWPAPARWLTGVCARRGVRPNTVTLLSLVLVLAATWAFARGWFCVGLLLGWVMTFLDTVDGKLARVTVDSSQFGHLFDHAIDLIHPPFWYLAWGWGLVDFSPALPQLSLEVLFGAIIVTYVAGRLIEIFFSSFVAGFSMFTWRAIDSYFRLVLARRNPNLLLLSVSLLAGRPDLGLLAVAAWTVISTGFLLVRLGMAIRWRQKVGPLRPWLEEMRGPDGGVPLLARPFAPQQLS
jgi:phosphatidylglycerophosphate synthase